MRVFLFRWVLAFVLLGEGGAWSAQVAHQTLSSGLVVADSEPASKAGMEILSRGGNAIDAAIATALALSVVDQASSGLGGGGFMVIYRAKDKKAFALDFRETAPAASRKELYMKDGKAVPSLSLTGALAVAVPGEVAGLIDAHKRFGTLPLSALAAPAIRLATDGFPVDGAMGVAIERLAPTMKRFPDLARIYLPRWRNAKRRSADSATRIGPDSQGHRGARTRGLLSGMGGAGDHRYDQARGRRDDPR